MSDLTITVCDGHFMRLVEIREIKEGTVAMPSYRVAVDETFPVSPEARAYRLPTDADETHETGGEGEE